MPTADPKEKQIQLTSSPMLVTSTTKSVNGRQQGTLVERRAEDNSAAPWNPLGP